MAISNLKITDAGLDMVPSGWVVKRVAFTETVATGGTPVTAAAVVSMDQAYKKIVPLAAHAQGAAGLAQAATLLVDSSGTVTNTVANQVGNQIKYRVVSSSAESVDVSLLLACQVS